MYFKPRIFISSTLAENLKIRSEIEEFFKTIGADVMLYEKNLTPSTVPLTYRKDIVDADFVIFIIKEIYGTKTDSGLSGTHEELLISLKNDTPKHIYIKKGTKSNDSESSDIDDIIEEINKNSISFFYFNDDNELIKRIKETVFVIARDIMLKKVQEAKLDTASVKKICVNHDYNLALGYLAIFEKLIDLGNNYYHGYLNSNLIISALDGISEHFKEKKFVFVDNKLNELLNNIIYEYDKFSSSYAIDYTMGNNHRDFLFPIYGNIGISSSIRRVNSNYTVENYEIMVKNILDKYVDFKNYIRSIKLDSDLLDIK